MASHIAGPQNGGMKIHNVRAFLVVVASIVLLGAVGIAKADEWFVMGEQAIKAENPSVEIKTQGNRWQKDVKQVKLSVEGADVQITNLVLGWDNRSDDTMANVGTLKAGGQTAAANAPGRKGRLKSVKIQYKILGKKPTATVKIWGLTDRRVIADPSAAAIRGRRRGPTAYDTGTKLLGRNDLAC